MKQNLEMYSGQLPSGQREYYMHYGEHFSKKAAEFAIKNMRKRGPSGAEEPIKPMSLEDVDDLLSRNGVRLKNDVGYDKVYLVAKCMSDYLGSSVPDETHVAKYVKDVLDDADGYDGMPFVEWYHKVLHIGIPVMWEDIM